ncbi:unnamed protein product [Chrysoparadoxa australica]
MYDMAGFSCSSPIKESREQQAARERLCSVDIGEVMGMDIGGTLCKLMYFEKKRPPEASKAAWQLDDPLREEVRLKRNVSLGNLHETARQKEALQQFYEFMETAGDGTGGVRDEELTFYSPQLGGQLHFFRFETRLMDRASEQIRQSTIHHAIKAIGCTGGGAFKYADYFHNKLNVEVLQMNEMACLVRGLQFVIANVPGECYTYKPEPKPEVCGVDEENEEFLDPQDTFRNMRMRHLSELREKVDYTFKVRRSNKELVGGYPALVVSIGSGVSILKVDGPAKFERVSGSSIGGGTYWGLARLLTGATDFDESLTMAEEGDSDLADMLVGDIYGRYAKFQLSTNTLASSFGKCMLRDNPREGLEDKDLAKALVVMITMNIGQVAYLNAKLYDTQRIYFVGNFLRQNRISARRLSFAIDYWSGGEMEALFFQHEGYLGALGAFLKSGTEK